MDLPKRKNIRLNGYNYSSSGGYFITICTDNRKCLLGDIVGDGISEVPIMKLSNYGVTVKNQIEEMATFYDYLKIDKYVIMPNHIHLISR